MNQHQMALNAWRNATLQNPNHLNAWSNMVILLDNLGKYQWILLVTLPGVILQSGYAYKL